MADPADGEEEAEGWPRRAYYPVALASRVRAEPQALRRFGQQLVAWRDETDRVVVHDADRSWPVQEVQGLVWTTPGIPPEQLFGLPGGPGTRSAGAVHARNVTCPTPFPRAMAHLAALTLAVQRPGATTFVSEAALFVGQVGSTEPVTDFVVLDALSSAASIAADRVTLVCGAAPIDEQTTWLAVLHQASPALGARVDQWLAGVAGSVPELAAVNGTYAAWRVLHAEHLEAQRWEEGGLCETSCGTVAQ